MTASVHPRIAAWSVLLLTAFSILWKGGKSLEATWLLGLVASLTTMQLLAAKLKRRKSHDDTPGDLYISHTQTSEVPFAIWIMVLLFVLWTIVSYIFSQTANYGLAEVLRTAAVALLFLWTVRATAERGSSPLLRELPGVLTATLMVACAVGLVVYVYQPVDRLVGTFFDWRFHTDYWPNAWAECIVLTWPMLLLKCVRRYGNGFHWWLVGGLGVVLGCLLLSYSRGAMIALAGQIVMALTLFGLLGLQDVRHRTMLLRSLRFVVPRLMVILVVGILTFAGANAARSQRFAVLSVQEKATFTAAEGRSSVNERAQFWQQGFDLSLEHPLVGWGPYGFRFVQPRLMEGVLATSDHPHNVILKLAVERGWPAALLFTGVVLYVVFAALWHLFRQRRFDWSQEKDLLLILLLIAVTGTLAHNMIDFNLQFVGILLPLTLYLGFLVAPVSVLHTSPASSFWRWRAVQRLFGIEVLLAVAMLAVLCIEGGWLMTSSLGRHAHAHGNTDEALRWYDASSPQLFSRDLQLSRAELLLEQGRTTEAMEAILTYQNLNELDPRGWSLRGEIERMSGDNRAALDSFMRAYNRGKYTDIGILRALLQVTIDGGYARAMIPREKEFIGIFQEFVDAILQNTHFIALSPNVEELQETARLLSRLYPERAGELMAAAAQALEHAKTERNRLSGRKEGILW